MGGNALTSQPRTNPAAPAFAQIPIYQKYHSVSMIYRHAPRQLYQRSLSRPNRAASASLSIATLKVPSRCDSGPGGAGWPRPGVHVRICCSNARLGLSASIPAELVALRTGCHQLSVASVALGELDLAALSGYSRPRIRTHSRPGVIALCHERISPPRIPHRHLPPRAKFEPAGLEILDALDARGQRVEVRLLGLVEVRFEHVCEVPVAGVSLSRAQRKEPEQDVGCESCAHCASKGLRRLPYSQEWEDEAIVEGDIGKVLDSMRWRAVVSGEQGRANRQCRSPHITLAQPTWPVTPSPP